MRKTLKAKEEFFYGGKTHKVGDHFDAVDPDANILVVTNKAELVAPDQKVKKPVAAPKLETAALTTEERSSPEAMTTENSGELSSGGRRKYMRRDMTAKE